MVPNLEIKLSMTFLRVEQQLELSMSPLYVFFFYAFAKKYRSTLNNRSAACENIQPILT